MILADQSLVIGHWRIIEMSSESIFEITAAAGRGDENAFDQFYGMYADRMYRYLLVVTEGNEDLAREVCQESLLRVVRHLKPFPSDEDVWRWLSRIMRSAFIDAIRKGKRGQELEQKYARYLQDILHASREEENESVLLTLLDKAVALLEPEDRTLVEGYYFDGYSQSDLAEQIGSTAKAVGMKLVRLRRQLKDIIMKELARGT